MGTITLFIITYICAFWLPSDIFATEQLYSSEKTEILIQELESSSTISQIIIPTLFDPEWLANNIKFIKAPHDDKIFIEEMTDRLTSGKYKKDALMYLGEYYYLSGRYAESKYYFLSTLRQSSDKELTKVLHKYSLGRLKHISDYYGDEESYFYFNSKLLEMEPDNAKLWLSHFTYYYKKRNYTEALNCVEQSLELNPDSIFARRGKFALLLAMGEPSLAFEYISNLIKTDPEKNSIHYFDMGNLYYHYGLLRVSERYYAKYLNIKLENSNEMQNISNAQAAIKGV